MVSIDLEKNYFAHEADIGVIGYGDSIEAALVNAAEAMFAIMVNIDQVSAHQEVIIEFEEEDEEIALIKWLNRLITESQIRELIFGRFALKRTGDRWQGKAWGEVWNKSLQRGTEVKGATLTMLSVTHDDHRYTVRCVVDV